MILIEFRVWGPENKSPRDENYDDLFVLSRPISHFGLKLKLKLYVFLACYK